MKKVYIVMKEVEYCMETGIPSIEKVFNSELKAIKYINDIWSDKITSYNTSTNVHCRIEDEYTKVFMYIKEYEVN